MSSDESHRLKHIRAQVKAFPQTPGVYLMKDSDGRVLYIGKAVNLRDRVTSYFQPSVNFMQSRGPKIAEMAEKVDSYKTKWGDMKMQMGSEITPTALNDLDKEYHAITKKFASLAGKS